MVTTWFDMGVMGREEAWRGIRQTRSGTAASSLTSTRRELFSSALEQSEQQFRASERVGVESRPLNLYYGLAQAGRALAAVLASADEDPNVSGHGLKLVGLDSISDPEALLDMEVRGSGGSRHDATLFGRVSRLLGSDPLDECLPLRSAWNALPEPSLTAWPGIPTPGWIDSRPDEPDTFGFELAEVDALAALTSTYPQLRLAKVTAAVKGFKEVAGERVAIREFSLASFRSQFANYRGTPFLMPVATDGHVLDPLMAWWILLYGLSMVARYRPVLWTRAVDIDRSPIAVPLEALLHKALDAVPDQIRVTISR